MQQKPFLLCLLIFVLVLFTPHKCTYKSTRAIWYECVQHISSPTLIIRFWEHFDILIFSTLNFGINSKIVCWWLAVSNKSWKWHQLLLHCNTEHPIYPQYFLACCYLYRYCRIVYQYWYFVSYTELLWRTVPRASKVILTLPPNHCACTVHTS